MASDGAKTKTLTDGDIATYARRGGPAAGGPGTDADTHTDVDAVATDHDTAQVAATDADTSAHTDKD